MKKALSLLVALGLMASFILSGCGEELTEPKVDEVTEAEAGSVFTRVLAAAPANVCPDDGIQVDAGFDQNGNKKLDDFEVVSTQYVCHGADGLASLVLVADEGPGANCAYGGKKVSVGLDKNKNGVLNSDEITSDNYLCNGASGAASTNGQNSLVKVIAEPAATNCPGGGVKITSGLDANDNGTLDSGEEGAPSYVCNGSSGSGTNVGISAPMGVVAAGADGEVTVTWNANPADEITSFNLYWSTDPEITKSNSTKIAGVTSPHTLTGLTNGTIYYFFVTGVNASGEGPASWPAEAIPGIPPLAPTGVTATAGNGQTTITWTAADDAQLYLVYRSLSSGVTVTPGNLIMWGMMPDDTTLIDWNVANGTTYYYVVTAVNGYGESVPSNEVSATPQGPPPAPTGFTATPGDSHVVLGWNASPGATSYNVYDVTMGSSLIASPTVTSYTVTGLTNGNWYCYEVSAVNAAGESSHWNMQCVSPNVAPQAPTGVSAAAGDGQVVVNWSPAPGISNYYVYWDTSPGVTKASPNRFNVWTGMYGGTYTHTGLANGTTYYYVVTAANTIESAESAEVSATPTTGNVAPATLGASNVTDTSATMNGSINNPPGYTTTVWFEYGTSTAYGEATAQSSYAYSGQISLNASLSNLTESTAYHYRIVAQNTAGTFFGNDRTFTTLKSPQVVHSGWVQNFGSDGTNIYWSQGSSLQYAPISGGTTSTLATGFDSYAMVVTANGVFTADNVTIRKIDKTTGAVTILASGLSNPHSLKVRDGYVYWAESNAVRKVNFLEAPYVVADIATGLSSARGIAVDGSNVYWLDNGGIKKASKDGGLITVLSPAGGERIAVDSENIYWSDWNLIRKMGLDGGPATELVTGLGSMGGVAFTLDETDVYFGSGSAISKIGKEGGPVTNICYNPGGYVQRLKKDATNVYWSNGMNGGLYKAAK